jgi:mono/diheme cytochrome c family protein
MIDATKVAGSESTPEPGEPDVEFGATTYARLCAECHGDEGEGVADKGQAVAAMDSEAALEDLLRTGGGYGPEHLFGPDKISPDGIMALHAFMETLPAP